MGLNTGLNQSDGDGDKKLFANTVKRLDAKSRGVDKGQLNYKETSVSLLQYDLESKKLVVRDIEVNYTKPVMLGSFNETDDAVTALLLVSDTQCVKMTGNRKKYTFISEIITGEQALLYMQSINN